MTDHPAQMADEVFLAVKAFVSRQTAALSGQLTAALERLEALEKRAPEKGERGLPGERGEQGQDGQSALLMVGEGPPLVAGKGSDIYIDTLTGDMYRCAD